MSKSGLLARQKAERELWTIKVIAYTEQQTLDALHGYNMPEVEYFIEHFIPAFEKTLDELGSID